MEGADRSWWPWWSAAPATSAEIEVMADTPATARYIVEHADTSSASAQAAALRLLQQRSECVRGVADHLAVQHIVFGAALRHSLVPVLHRSDEVNSLSTSEQMA